MDQDPMLEAAHANLLWELERIIACVRDAGPERARAHPPAPGANSLTGIAAHAMGAAREHVLGWCLGRTVDPHGDAFDDGLSLEDIEARHRALVANLGGAFGMLRGEDLSRPVATPGRGPQPVRDVLWWSVLHAAEHAGAAELTRDLVLAAASAGGGESEAEPAG